jgi:DNA-binding PadR family transcriptional regulator
MSSAAFAHQPPWVRYMGRGRPRRDRIDELERMVAIGQFARGTGPGPGGPFGGGRGRKRRGDVRVALLLLLAEEPRNGYQLMQEIEERSRGHWRPSPGSVYPTLQQLEDEGLIRPIDADGTKLFELTDAGRQHVSDSGHTPPWDADDDSEDVSDMKHEIKQLHIAAMMVLRAGNEEQIALAAKVLARARRSIYGILAEDAGE